MEKKEFVIIYTKDNSILLLKNNILNTENYSLPQKNLFEDSLNLIHFEDAEIETQNLQKTWIRIYFNVVDKKFETEFIKKLNLEKIKLVDLENITIHFNHKLLLQHFKQLAENNYLKLFNFKENIMNLDCFVQRRENVVIILENLKGDEILCLKWNNERKWKSLIGGGIENHDIITSALLEIKEESGYDDIEVIKELQSECHDKFYAPHKSINRYAINRGIVCRLKSNSKIKISTSEKKIHEPLWIKKEEVLNFLSDDLENHKILFKEYLGEKIKYDNLNDLFN